MEVNIEMYLIEMNCKGVYWIQVDQDLVNLYQHHTGWDQKRH